MERENVLEAAMYNRKSYAISNSILGGIWERKPHHLRRLKGSLCYQEKAKL